MNHAPDVGRVLRPEGVLDVLADRVEFVGDLFDVRATEVQVAGNIGDRHQGVLGWVGMERRIPPRASDRSLEAAAERRVIVVRRPGEMAVRTRCAASPWLRSDSATTSMNAGLRLGAAA